MRQRSYPRFRRRHFLTDKALQSRFILGFSLVVFFGILINLLVAYFLIDRELTAELYKIHLKVRTTSEIALPILWKLGAVTVPIIVIIAALIGRYFTRRVEEPLVPFLNVLKKTGEGDFTGRLDTDGEGRLNEVFGAFNDTCGIVEDGFGSIKDAVADLERGLDDVDAMVSSKEGAPDAELSKALDALSALSEKALKELSRFKT
ncbi:MAG: methyl-accepting chemotaxis protein [Thermodesulfobacteriota bacterium]